MTSYSITVQWGPVECIDHNGDITGYSVHYAEVRNGNVQIMSVPGGDATGTTISTNVMPLTNYSIQVAAVNIAGTGIYSDPVTVTTHESEINLLESAFVYQLSTLFSTGAYISLNGNIIPNHGYVVFSDIGSTDNTALKCHTNRPPPVNGNPNSGGDWFAPDQTRVYRNRVEGFRKNRSPMVMRLLRETATDPPDEGIYHCVIKDATLTRQDVWVGLYNSGGGIINLFLYTSFFGYFY